jgi:hypothetical protein
MQFNIDTGAGDVIVPKADCWKTTICGYIFIFNSCGVRGIDVKGEIVIM